MNEAVAKFLEARPVGALMWIRVHGRSMFPVLRSGDSLHVLRCGPSDVRRGDIAVARRPGGQLVAHLVVSERPPVLTTFRGGMDPIGTEVLGRVVAVRSSSGRTIEFPAWSRTALLAASRALQLGLGSASARAVARRLRDHCAPLLASVRQLRHGPPRHQVLSSLDTEAATAFVFSVQDVPFERIRRDVEAGRAHALLQGGAIRALALLGSGDDAPIVIRPHNRLGLGYERQLLSSIRL